MVRLFGLTNIDWHITSVYIFMTDTHHEKPLARLSITNWIFLCITNLNLDIVGHLYDLIIVLPHFCYVTCYVTWNCSVHLLHSVLKYIPVEICAFCGHCKLLSCKIWWHKMQKPRSVKPKVSYCTEPNRKLTNKRTQKKTDKVENLILY